MLAFLHVQKTYGARRIISISDAILPTGIHWLQGSNGSGKTTLLRMIAGLIPFKGDIHLDGSSLRYDPVTYRNAVGWADAEPQYPPFLTGEDLLSFYLSIRKTSSAPSDASALVATFSMQSYITTRIGSWSDGMIKKLSLVLAFIGNPPLVVLDEPLVTLDTASVQLLYRTIRDQHSRGGTILLTSHQDLDDRQLSIDKKLMIREQTLQIQA